RDGNLAVAVLLHHLLPVSCAGRFAIRSTRLRSAVRILGHTVRAGDQCTSADHADPTSCHPAPPPITIRDYHHVPIARARLWATMTYTQTRIGEARVFEVPDLDTSSRRVRIKKALDPERGIKKKTGKLKAPKAGRPREMRMEVHLVPLIEALIAECGG